MLLKTRHILILPLLITLGSCSQPEIPLDTIRETSVLLHCDKVYGTSAKKIEEENEIIIQTGKIDTTDEHPPINAAIIKVKSIEVVLNQLKTYKLKESIVEEYSGDNYVLTISYEEKGRGIFEGSCTITKGKLKSMYDIVGITNTHRY